MSGSKYGFDNLDLDLGGGDVDQGSSAFDPLSAFSLQGAPPTSFSLLDPSLYDDLHVTTPLLDSLIGQGTSTATTTDATGGASGTPQSQPGWSFDLLPPKLSGPLFGQNFTADTGGVSLSGGQDTPWRFGAKYDGTGFFNLEHGDFRGSLTANPFTPSIGGGLEFGKKLPPLAMQMHDTFNKAGQGLTNMVTGLPGAFGDPLGYYDAHHDNLSSITSGVSMFQQLQTSAKDTRPWGASLNFGADPDQKWMMLQAGVSF